MVEYRSLEDRGWPFRLIVLATCLATALIWWWPAGYTADPKTLEWRDDSLCAAATRLGDGACLGAPYLYATFHGGKKESTLHNVCRYSRDGCSLGSVLEPTEAYGPHSIRGLVVAPSGNLLLTEAYRQASKVVEFSDCGEGGRRRFLRFLATNVPGNTGLIHPYGIALNTTGTTVHDMFVSAQGTFAVYRYNYETGMPEPVPPGLHARAVPDRNGNSEKVFSREKPAFWKNVIKSTYRSTRLQDAAREKLARFVFPGQFVNLDGAEVRGVSIDRFGRLWVSNKREGVQVYDGAGQLITTPLTTESNRIPVSLTLHGDYAYVSCLRNHSVVEIDVLTMQVGRQYTTPGLKHPSSAVVFGRTMFVASQLTVRTCLPSHAAQTVLHRHGYGCRDNRPVWAPRRSRAPDAIVVLINKMKLVCHVGSSITQIGPVGDRLPSILMPSVLEDGTRSTVFTSPVDPVPDVMLALAGSAIFKQLRVFSLEDFCLHLPWSSRYSGLASLLFEAFDAHGLAALGLWEPERCNVEAWRTLPPNQMQTVGSECLDRRDSVVIVDIGDHSTVVHGMVSGTRMRTESYPVCGDMLTDCYSQICGDEVTAETGSRLQVASCFREFTFCKGLGTASAAVYAPPELLFNPSAFQTQMPSVRLQTNFADWPSLPEIVVSFVQKAPIDFRRTLYQNIAVSGSISRMQGFGPRLATEVQRSITRRYGIDDE